MKIRMPIKILSVLMCCALLICGMPGLIDSAQAAGSGVIRVRIATASDVSRVVVLSRGNYSIDGDASRPFTSGKTATVYVEGGQLHVTVDGVTYDMGSSFKLVRHLPDEVTNAVSFSTPKLSNYFPGDVEFVLTGGTIQTVNHVYIEDYLRGVLAAEWSEGHAYESLKAMAVIARTYARRYMASPAGSYYDIKNTSAHQNYKGVVPSQSNTARAVSETEGIVVRYNGSLIESVYGASNGGQIESAQNWWGGSGYPYYKVKDDPYDYANPSSPVKRLTVYSDFDAHLSSTGMSALNKLLLSEVADELDDALYSTDTDDITIKTVVDVYPHTPKYSSPSRVYTKMRFELKVASVSKSTGAAQDVPGTVEVDLDIFDDLDNSTFGLSLNGSANELFTVEESGDNFVIESRRWGHGIGYSQYGGEQMAREGYNWRKILDFYHNDMVTYPTEKLSRPSLTALGDAPSATPTVTPKPTPLPECELFEAPVRAIVNVSTTLNLRVEPMNGARVLTTLKDEDVVAAIGVIGDWTFVEYNNTYVGYVSSRYIQLTDTPMATSDPGVTYAPTASPTPSPTPIIVPDDGKYMQVLCETYVNLRSGPGTSYDTLAQLHNGDLVKLLDVNGSWSHVMYGDMEGYVSSSLLTSVVTATAAPSGAPTATPDPEVTPTAPATRQAEVNCDGVLNVRQSASTSSRILGTLRPGDRVTVVSESNGWAQIEYGSGTAYVSAQYIRYIDAPTPTPTPGAEATPTAPAARQAEVNCNGVLNVRQSASTGSRILGTLRPGDRVTVVSESNGWAQIEYGSGTAYVSAQYIRYIDAPIATPKPTATPAATPQATAQPARQASVNCSSSLNVRQSASTSSRIVGTLKPGDRVMVLSESNGWAQIEYGSGTAYVSAQYLVYGSQATAAPTATGSATAAPTAAPTGTPVQPVSTTATLGCSGAMNIRQLPTTESTSLGTVRNGETVIVHSVGNGVDGDWANITYSGKRGYVKTKYLVFDGDAQPTPTAQPSTTDKPAATPTPDATYIPGVTTKGRVTASELNMRLSASTSADIVYTLKRGDEVDIVDITASGGWYYVIYKDYEGYCSAQYILPFESSDSLAAVGERMGGATLMAEADPEAEVVRELMDGEVVEVLERADSWALVRTIDGESGYVSQDMLGD